MTISRIMTAAIAALLFQVGYGLFYEYVLLGVSFDSVLLGSIYYGPIFLYIPYTLALILVFQLFKFRSGSKFWILAGFVAFAVGLFLRDEWGIVVCYVCAACVYGLIYSLWTKKVRAS